MSQISLFDTPESHQVLAGAAVKLMAYNDNEKLYRLGRMLNIIETNAVEFDKYCQINIEMIGSRALSQLGDIENLRKGNMLDLVIGWVYRILVEYDLSVKHDVSEEISSFMNLVLLQSKDWEENAKRQIEFARDEMPIRILKRLLNSDELGNLRNISSVAEEVEDKISKWNDGLELSEAKAERLGATFDKQSQAFNFVGLRDGFAGLAADVKSELSFAQCGMLLFGLLLLIPSSVDIWLVLSEIDLSKLSSYTLIAASVGTVTLTLLFLYFFRIALRKADSCRAQLIQIRLRMTLCQFIQSYADYSSTIKEKNPDALSKFEALIFSGIVGAEDKLPSTFDGIDQLGALAKSIRGG